jgi:hypothetical protein
VLGGLAYTPVCSSARRDLDSAYGSTASSAGIAGSAQSNASSPSSESARSGASTSLSNDAAAGYMAKKERFAKSANAASAL